MTWKITGEGRADRFMGICSLHHYDEKTQSIEFGGTLFPQYWGKDIMRKAFHRLIEKAQEIFSLNQVICRTIPSNRRAVEFAVKSGFEIMEETEDEIVLKLILPTQGHDAGIK